MLDQPSVPPPPTYITSPTPTPPPGALLWHGGPGAWGPYITSALVAHHLLESKVDYIVDGDSVVLLDRATGRVKPRSRLQAMLHQSLEAKHGITPQPLSSTHASVSLQALVRFYGHVCGMTVWSVVVVRNMHVYSMCHVVYNHTHRHTCTPHHHHPHTPYTPPRALPSQLHLNSTPSTTSPSSASPPINPSHDKTPPSPCFDHFQSN